MRLRHQIVFTGCAPERKLLVGSQIAKTLVKLGLCRDDLHAATTYGAIIAELSRPEYPQGAEP